MEVSNAKCQCVYLSITLCQLSLLGVYWTHLWPCILLPYLTCSMSVWSLSAYISFSCYSSGLQATLLMISQRYKRHKQIFSILSNIFNNSIVSSHEAGATPCIAASTLLSQCNKALDDAWLITDQVDVVSNTSCCSYLVMPFNQFPSILGYDCVETLSLLPQALPGHNWWMADPRPAQWYV